MNTLGSALRLTLFGASHDTCIGCVLDGIPSGYPIDEKRIAADLELRRPAADIGTERHEPDIPIITGIRNGKTTGIPLTITFTNEDIADCTTSLQIPRPGHADYPAYCKYGSAFDARGGGMFSGRMTAPLVAVGGLLRPFLFSFGIEVGSYLTQVGTITDLGNYTPDQVFTQSRTNSLRAMNKECEEQMRAEIREAKANGDSVGGSVRCMATELPVGLGEPFFDSLDGVLAHAIFSVPGIKGVSFGEGFHASSLRGSENNDGYRIAGNGNLKTETNHAGGILGGMANGSPLVMDVAFKPTPSISRFQHSVNLLTRTETDVSVHGRYDACIAPRGAIVVEAVTIFTIADFLIRGGYAETITGGQKQA